MKGVSFLEGIMQYINLWTIMAYFLFVMMIHRVMVSYYKMKKAQDEQRYRRGKQGYLASIISAVLLAVATATLLTTSGLNFFLALVAVPIITVLGIVLSSVVFFLVSGIYRFITGILDKRHSRRYGYNMDEY